MVNDSAAVVFDDERAVANAGAMLPATKSSQRRLRPRSSVARGHAAAGGGHGRARGARWRLCHFHAPPWDGGEPPLAALAAHRVKRRIRATDQVEAIVADPLIAEAWGLKEAFRAVYEAADRPEAERRLDLFLAAVGRSGLTPFEAFAKGVGLWREELLAFFEGATTNGYAEGVIKGQGDQAPRLRTAPFKGFRERVLLACG